MTPKSKLKKTTDKIIHETSEKVSVLGQEYSIEYVEGNSPVLGNGTLSGCCDKVTKEIYLSNDLLEENELNSPERVVAYSNQILRHELIHAFFTESGLWDECHFADDEVNIDWLAIQWPKITKAFIEAGAITKEEIGLDVD